MKRIFYLTARVFILFFLVFIFSSQKILAQKKNNSKTINFTIDNTQPTGGTNFQNFYDACSYLNSLGSATDVIIFDVVAGQVFSGDSVYINNLNTSGGEQVIFQKSGTGANPIIQNDNVDEAVIWLNFSNNIVFDAIDVADPTPDDPNKFNKAYYFVTSNNCEIKNANIVDFDEYGIYLDDGCSYINIDNNNLFYTGNYYTSQSSVYAIYASTMDIKPEVNITNNEIYGIKEVSSTFYGIRSMRSSGLIANNFISAAFDNNDKIRGFRIDAAPDAGQIVYVYHNTVVLEGTATDDGCCYYGTGVTAEIYLKNNIFINRRVDASPSDIQAALDITFNGPDYYIDYNVYYTDETDGFLCAWYSTEATTLEQWQAAYGGDYNSVVTDVDFMDSFMGDLHITGSLLGDFILAGNYIAEAPQTDIDGQNRDNEYPYKGADENIDNPLNLHIDCDVYSIDFSDVFVDSAEVLSFEIQNNGSESIILDSINFPPAFTGKFDALDWSNHFENIDIDAGNSKTVDVKFEPTQVSNYDSVAYIYVPNGQIIEVELLGNGIAIGINVTADLIDFGAVLTVDTSDVETFTIENTGTETLDINFIEAPTDFKIRLAGNNQWENTISSFNIDVGNSKDVEVVFMPSEIKDYNDSLLVGSNIDIYVALTGRGKAVDFELNNVGQGVWYGATDAGDYDNDGDMDLIITGYGIEPFLGNVYLYQNNGDNTFSEVTTNIMGVGNGTVNFVDYDNDNDLDVFIAGQNDWAKGSPIVISKLYQNNDGNFTEVFSGFAGFESPKSDWADIDLDGDMDLAFMGADSTDGTDMAYLKIYENRGNNQFVEIQSFDGATGDLKFADYDNDTDPDIAFTGRNTSSNYISKILKNDNGTFSDISAGLYGLRYSDLSWGDFDNDKDLDLIISGSVLNEDPSIGKIYRNDGNDVFTDISADIIGVRHGDVKWIDMNNDGNLDFIMDGIYINDQTWAGYIYINQGNEDFLLLEDTLTSLKYAEIIPVDLDNDLDNDIIITGKYSYQNYWAEFYENKYPVENNAPTAPSNFDYVLNADEITFNWNDGSDNETTNLSYNLKVGTSSEDNDVLSSVSANSGYRKIPARGNLSYNNSFTFSPSVSGTLFASIQSVDDNFVGSEFSDEVSFEYVSVNELCLKFDVYPNPASDKIFIDLSDFNETIVSIFDINGKKLKTKKVAGKDVYEFNIAGFEKGIYTIVLKNGNKFFTSKVILK